MPFIVISGTYHLVGDRAGRPSGFQPDGDSMQFKPKNPKLLDRLTRIDQPYRLTTIGSTQLRFEGIDALELHFQGAHQPRPLADSERDYLTGQLKMNPVNYAPPNKITVQPPAVHDGIKGYILARSLEVHGRPVAFAYSGTPPARDGGQLTLKGPLLRQSLNYKSLASGNSYPLFYDTLFADLRDIFITAATRARSNKKGLWSQDLTSKGITAKDEADLETNAVVFPKLFRRLTSYLTTGATHLNGFLPWLQKDKEQVLDLTSGNFTHFDNMLAVANNKVKLTQPPETLVFVSAKTTSTHTSPWLSH